MDYDDRSELEDDLRPADPAVERAIERLDGLFDDSPRTVLYSTQIETLLEREFFHWIVGRALLEMANVGRIQRQSVPVGGQVINFYAHRTHRYIRRELRAMAAIICRIFDPEFAHAIGRQGELMFDAALGRNGFRAEATDANSHDGRIWTKTAHNLDRIVTRDNISYGVEIKNTQNYIPRSELLTKIRLCRFLGLKPLFIMRFAPKSYMNDIFKSGGFGLLFEDQLYPWGHGALLNQVRKQLGLKVSCPRDVPDGHMQRLLNWHEKTKHRPSQ